MRISDWSSDVCSSDLSPHRRQAGASPRRSQAGEIALARVELAPGVGEDLDRILDHLEQHVAVHVAARLREIIDALGVLETNPLIGRPARDDQRELVIGRGSPGYAALYRPVPATDGVFVLAVRWEERRVGEECVSTGR